MQEASLGEKRISLSISLRRSALVCWGGRERGRGIVWGPTTGRRPPSNSPQPRRQQGATGIAADSSNRPENSYFIPFIYYFFLYFLKYLFLLLLYFFIFDYFFLYFKNVSNGYWFFEISVKRSERIPKQKSNLQILKLFDFKILLI